MLSEQQQRIMGYFIEEAKDHLNTIEQGLVNLQGTINDPEMVNEVFRAAHSVKGGAAMLGLSSIQRTAHRLEDCFKVLKECPQVHVDQKLETLFLRVYDTLHDLVDQLQGPFGLTEDKAQEAMANVEPVFAELGKHLDGLVSQVGGTLPEDVNLDAIPLSSPPIAVPPVSAPPQVVQPAISEESAFQFIFQNDVPARLREMLQLFKQAEHPSSREQLQAICRSLAQPGEQFNLPDWCELLATAQRAIRNEENTYRTLAPVIIKDIKRAQEFVLSGRAANVSASEDLLSLLPPPPVAEVTPDVEAFLDFADFLSDDADISADASISSLTETSGIAAEADPFAALFGDTPSDESSTATDWLNDLSDSGEIGEANPSQNFSDEDDASELDFGLDFDEALSVANDTTTEALDLSLIDQIEDSPPSGEEGDRTGPEVGVTELNSLADLFEGELPDLGLTWQEEEILDPTTSQQSFESSDTQNLGDYSDLFNTSSESDDGSLEFTLEDEEEDLSGLLNATVFQMEAAHRSDSSFASQPDIEASPEEPIAELILEQDSSDDIAVFFTESVPETVNPADSAIEVPAPSEPVEDASSSFDNLDELFLGMEGEDFTTETVELPDPEEEAEFQSIFAPTEEGDVSLENGLLSESDEFDSLFDAVDGEANEPFEALEPASPLEESSEFAPEERPEPAESLMSELFSSVDELSFAEIDGTVDAPPSQGETEDDRPFSEIASDEISSGEETIAPEALSQEDLTSDFWANPQPAEMGDEPSSELEGEFTLEFTEEPTPEAATFDFNSLLEQANPFEDANSFAENRAGEDAFEVPEAIEEPGFDFADLFNGTDSSVTNLSNIDAPGDQEWFTQEEPNDGSIADLSGDVGLESLWDEAAGVTEAAIDSNELEGDAPDIADFNLAIEEGEEVHSEADNPFAAAELEVTGAEFDAELEPEFDLAEIEALHREETLQAELQSLAGSPVEAIIEPTEPEPELSDSAPLDFELTSSNADDFANLDIILSDEEAEHPIAIEASQDNFSAVEQAFAPIEDDFADLSAMLGDEPPPVIASSHSQEAVESDDFADLEALLDNEPLSTPENFPPTAVVSPAATVSPNLAGNDDEFGDLEALLQEADQKLGVGSSPVRSVAGAAARRPSRRNVISDQTMRVSVKHLDNLNNLVGEMVVNRNSLEQAQERLRQFLDNLLYQVQQLSDVGQRMRDLYERSLLESSLLSSRRSYQLSGGNAAGTSQSNHATGASFDALEMDRFTGFHTLSQEMIELIVRVRESASDIDFVVEESDQVTRNFRQITTQLQEGLTRSRMVPFAQTADRLPRGVRDNAIKYGKQAELLIEGRDTLIDKMIVEQLYDPMTHLVNNAIAHGIETPEVRSAAGKPPVGRITIRAFHQGNQTVISVSDDGAGINPETVKAKALAKGLIHPGNVEQLSRLDVYDLLFHHGFSTADQVDDLRGRGVGLDVVRNNLSEIRGVITIDSSVGKGTTFTIRLPLTLSISKALCCISNRARIAFPMDGVEDMLDVPKDRIQTDEQGRSCIQWRDALLPFQPLAELLKYNRVLGRGSVYGGNQEEDVLSVVVLRSAGNYLALQVDQVLGEQEIVIKQLEGPVPKPIGVAGATVLGDGRIMPIADVLELIDLSQGRIRREANNALWETSGESVMQDPTTLKTEPTVLIVDDSITVRELLSMTFNKVGYRVEQARDGQEAWEKLRSGLPCDLVFCDIEMPRMDGLELLSRLQKDPSLSEIPIAMLTSRGADRHRQMAVQLGAKGYFTKPYLEEVLLDAAQRMLKGEVLVATNA